MRIPDYTLRKIESPTSAAVVGKPRTYETDDGNMNVAIRPESINRVGEVQMAREKYGGSIGPYREEAIAALESLETTDEPWTKTRNQSRPK